MESALEMIWTLLNSPLAITVVGGLILWGLNRLYGTKPLWQKYEGAVISGIKMAEKQIPDGHSNTAVARLDAALKYVVRVFEEVNKRRASNEEVIELRDGIQRKYADLEAAGNLTKAKSNG